VCTTARYEIEIPAGWAEDDCTRFTSGSFPAADAPIEFRPEIDVSFTTSENFAQALARIQNTEVILSTTSQTVDGLPAQRLVLRDEWFDVGERTVVVIDTGDGVFFASANQLIDIQGPIQTDLSVHYAQTLGVFDSMLSTISISATSGIACPAPVVTNPTIVRTGVVNIDNDTADETLHLVHHDDGVLITIDGLTTGVVWGQVESNALSNLDQLGWHDWNQDGVPEIIYRSIGPASGDLYGVRTINGCALVPVVDQDGQPTMLLSRASGLTANNYVCMYGPSGALTWLETNATTIDGNDGTSSTEVTPYSYSNGVLTAGVSTTVTSPPSGPPAGIAGCVIELF